MKVHPSHEKLPVDSAYNDSVSELGKQGNLASLIENRN